MSWKWWMNKKTKKDKKKEKKGKTQIQLQLGDKSDGRGSTIKDSTDVPKPPAPTPPSSVPTQGPNFRRTANWAPGPQSTVSTSPPVAHILTLPSPLLHHIITARLEPSCAILLSISCKVIYSLVRESIPTLYGRLITSEDKLALLRLFPPQGPLLYSLIDNSSSSSPTRRRTKERVLPVLCVPCLIYHSSEYHLMYPHPRPEAIFLSYADFALQKPRVCVRDALRRGRWTAGADMGDGEHHLCAECLTPKAKTCGLCAWNCMGCGRCTDRAAWGSRCVVCTGGGESNGEREGMGFEKAREAASGLWIGKPVEKDIVNSEPLVGRLWKPLAMSTALVGIGNEAGKVRTCGKCLGIIGFAEEMHDLCRCGEETMGNFDR